MAFQIKKRDSYRWPVEHVVEIKDGKRDTMKFDAEFKALPQKEVEAVLDLASTGSISDPEFLDKVLANWHGLDDGRVTPPQPFVYSVENRDLLLQLFPGLGAAFGTAWTESVLGKAAVRKN